MTNKEERIAEIIDEELSVALADQVKKLPPEDRIKWEDPEDDTPVSFVGFRKPTN